MSGHSSPDGPPGGATGPTGTGTGTGTRTGAGTGAGAGTGTGTGTGAGPGPGTGDSSSSTGGGNPPGKRARILDAAVLVFAEKGFYGAKVAEIAREAGVADGTIYLYFKSKDDLLISLF